LLWGIWREVLGVEALGVEDNFFELGGDSILSIQIIARAGRAGLRLTPRQLFQHQTIAELAAVAEAAEREPVAPRQDVATGALSLVPIQRWFFEQEFTEPWHWNQSVLLGVRRAVDPELLSRALEVVWLHHDALRQRFARQPDGSWRGWIEAASVGRPPELERCEPGVELEPLLERLQSGLSLEQGRLVRAAWLAGERPEDGRLLWVIHHLAVDGVSWRILLEDFETAYERFEDGAPAVELPERTSSYRAWAALLAERARGDELGAETSFWRAGGAAEARAGELPRDVVGTADTVSEERTVQVSLDEAATASLLRELPATYRAGVEELLLAALVGALCEWTGGRSQWIELEGHGRESERFEAGVDLSRSVGWFTTTYPLRLDLGDTADPVAELKQIKERMRAVPGRGLGYGMLRYLRGDADLERALRQSAERAQVSFNYLGRLDAALSGSRRFTVLEAGVGPERSAAARRSHALDVTARVLRGRLEVLWSYGSRRLRRETVEWLAARCLDRLGELIERGRSSIAEGYTPSDFPLARFDQKRLDRLTARLSGGRRST
jgi:non-ribosomal peptide synthase protein (TIGR01720 family)